MYFLRSRTVRKTYKSFKSNLIKNSKRHTERKILTKWNNNKIYNNQAEILGKKNIIVEIENSSEINDKMNTAKKWVSKLEDRIEDIVRRKKRQRNYKRKGKSMKEKYNDKI